MTDTTNPLEVTQEQAGPDELTLLKQQATMMNIPFSNNIKVETLRAKIAAKMDGEQDNTDEEGNTIAQPNPLVGSTAAPAPVTTKRTPSLAEYMQKEALKLVRIRIACMDPKKQDLPGEIFTVANEHLGTVKKFVPFGEQTDGGYHVPHCIYELLKAREFLHVQTRTVNGQIETKTRWVKEFSIEVLPQLTDEEIQDLAADQRATGRLAEES